MSPRQTRAARRAEAEQHVPIDTPSIVADESRPPSSLERKSARKPLKDIAGNVDESATRTSVGKKSNKGRKRTNAKKTAELQEDWVFEDQENGNEKDGSNSDGVEIEQQHVGNVEHKGVSQEEAGDEEEMDNGQEVAQEDAVLHLVKIEEVVIDVLEVTTPVEVCTDKQDDVELSTPERTEEQSSVHASIDDEDQHLISRNASATMQSESNEGGVQFIEYAEEPITEIEDETTSRVGSGQASPRIAVSPDLATIREETPTPPLSTTPTPRNMAADYKTPPGSAERLAVIKEVPRRVESPLIPQSDPEDNPQDIATPLASKPSPKPAGGRVSEAVQRLEALFEPASTLEKEEVNSSPIEDILSRTPGPQPKQDPIPALDAPDQGTEATAEITPPSDEQTPSKREDKVCTPGSRPSRAQHVVRSSRPSTLKKASTTIRKSSVQASARVSSQHLTLTPIKSDAASKVKQRSAIAALHTPPPVAKSDKPATKANFQLPGEAIAAKLKLQREERLKRDSVEEQKKREFKARPITRPLKPVEVKTTAASRARISLAGTGGAGSSQRDARQSLAGTLSKRSSVSHVRASMTSNSGLARQSAKSNVATSAKAQIKASKTPRPSENDPKVSAASGKAKDKTHTSSKMTSPGTTEPLQPRASTSGEATKSATAPPVRRPVVEKGKQVFNRDKVDKEERDKALQAKMDATRKARAEAAERGRLASREWAEKKKAAAGCKSVEGGAVSGGGEQVDENVAVKDDGVVD